MAKEIVMPTVRPVEDTFIGRQLATDSEAREFHCKIVDQLRKAVRPELEVLERSERITSEDLREVIY